MIHLWLIMRRELGSIFSTPIAYAFILMFLMMSGALTFFASELYEDNQTDLIRFFTFLPWLFLFLVPALGMKTWSEERTLGTIELLVTLPISLFSVAFGKFFALWLVIGFSLLLTFPLWLTLGYLGDPNMEAIIIGYVGSWLMSSAFLAITMLMSALNLSLIHI